MQQLLTGRTGRTLLSVVVATLVVTAGVQGVVGVAVGADPGTETTSPLDTCGTIDEPGTYTLTRNITEAPASGCFSVRADGVTIDGDGHTVVGNGSGVGVIATGADQLTVRNVTLTDWATGVAVTAGGARPTVRNVTVTNGSVGVAVFDGSVAATVRDSQFTNLTGVGVELQADEARVVDNTLDDTGAPGINLEGSDDTTVFGNELRTTRGGIVVGYSTGVTVEANTLHDVNGTGIHVVGEGETWWASYAFGMSSSIASSLSPSAPRGTNEVAGNTVADTDGNAVVVENASDVVVVENYLVRNRDGVRVMGTSDVAVVSNLAIANRDDGVSFGGAPGGVVHNNTLRNNADDGIYVVGNNTTVTANVATANGDDGLDVHNSTWITVTGNNFSENRNDGVFFRSVVEAVVEANRMAGNSDDGVDLRGTDLVTVANNTVCANQDRQFISREGANRTTTANNGC
jgi:parallel beta-helix repeat protein